MMEGERKPASLAASSLLIAHVYTLQYPKQVHKSYFLIPHWIDGTRFVRLNSDFPLAPTAFELATNIAWANMKREMYKAKGFLISIFFVLPLVGVASLMQPRLA